MSGSAIAAPVIPRARPVGHGRVGQGLVAVARAALPVLVVLAAQLVFFPMPVGVWVQGLVLGLLSALMAVGLGLVYRLNRIVNFAQGGLGSAPAVLAFGLIGLSGINYFVGLATGLVSVIVLTVAVETLVIRRFSRAPRLIFTVATIGLSQALVVVSLLIPRLWGITPIATASVHLPWHLTWRLAPVVLTADDLVAVAVALAALAGLALWLRSSEQGIATRATGDRRDRAAMLGIPVNRLQTVTWVVAGTLSFVSVFLKATVVGLPLDPTFSLIALVSALGALALGGFTNLGLVASAAVAIGILEQGVAWDEPTRPTVVLAVLAAVVMVGMVLRQLGGRAAGRDQGTQWSLAAHVRDIAPAVRRTAEVRVAEVSGGVLMVAFLATLPLWLGPGDLLEVANLLVLAMVGCSLVVLTGWGGQVSLAQLSFAAVGAAVAAVALADWHWDLSLALLLAGGAAAAVSFLVGLPTLRLEGVFVAVTTLAFGLAASGYLLDSAQFSWIPSAELGTVDVFGVPLVSERAVFLTCIGVGVLVVAAMHGLRHSRFGRVLRAVSTNERAAAGFGVHVARTKLTGFAVAGAIAGVAGGLLLVVNQQYVESVFTVNQSLAVLTATAVGGLGSVAGAVVGAALIEGSTVFLPPSWQLLPSAVGVLVVLLALPGGATTVWFTARDRLLATVARRHGLGAAPVAPSGPRRTGAPDGPRRSGAPDGPRRSGAPDAGRDLVTGGAP
jgi:branched-chain amino acid transport system permease protein